ncbi:hypothetical protein C8C85_1825 [Flavobacterium sp. 103]|nr:hypothetical protein C8C85_1825 [Flavobacterium sp. 103]
MYICLVPLVLVLNYFIFSILKALNETKKLLLYVILFFFLSVVLTKFYNYLKIGGLPDGFGFFILLNFSWGILLLYLMKKVINKKVNIAQSLKVDNYLPPFTYLKILTIIITVFQLYLILSKTIYIFRS